MNGIAESAHFTICRNTLRLLLSILFSCYAMAAFAVDTAIPEGDLEVRVTSSGLVEENYYITKGHRSGFIDSLVPMKVVQDENEFRYAEFTVVSSQKAKITFSSDDQDSFDRTFDFTPGIYFIGMQYHSPLIGTDYARIWIQKWDGSQFGDKLFEDDIDTDEWGQAYFRTNSNNHAGILQTIEVTKSNTNFGNIAIPDGNLEFSVEDLFPYTVVCHFPVGCEEVTRNIMFGSYGQVDITEGGSATEQVTMFDEFNVDEDSSTLRIAHQRIDSDGDGVVDLVDNCVAQSNPAQLDYDGDSIGNVCDADMDGEGIANSEDSFPLDPSRWGSGDGADLMVASYATNTDETGRVLRYDGATGIFLGVFSKICNTVDLAYGPDQRLYVAGTDHPMFGGCDPVNVVGRYDGETGEFNEIDDPHAHFVALEAGRFLVGPGGLAFGPGGDLYVSDPAENSVHRFAGPLKDLPGSYIGAFVSAGAGGLNDPSELLFGPDGNLYVISRMTHSILRYQGPAGTQPGAFMDAFVVSGSGGLEQPRDMTFDTDGRLYVISAGANKVLRFAGPSDINPGAFIDEFVAAPPLWATGMVFGNDGDLYVSGLTLTLSGWQVARFDGTSGVLEEVFAYGSRLSRMIFSAIPGPVLIGDFNEDQCVDTSDLNVVLEAMKQEGYQEAFDLNVDGKVNIADARKLVTLFSHEGGSPCP